MLIREVRRGLLRRPARFAPWMFYDARGSRIFERITELPEYYPTRTSATSWRAIAMPSSPPLVLVQSRSGAHCGAGCGHGVEDRASCSMLPRDCRSEVLYAPVDVSSDALDVACETIATSLPEVCRVADCGELRDPSATARTVRRNDAGVIHRFKHRKLHARGGPDNSWQSGESAASGRCAAAGGRHGEGRADSGGGLR